MTEYRYGPRHYHHYYHGKTEGMTLGSILGTVGGGVVLLGLALGGWAPSDPPPFDPIADASNRQSQLMSDWSDCVAQGPTHIKPQHRTDCPFPWP